MAELNQPWDLQGAAPGGVCEGPQLSTPGGAAYEGPQLSTSGGVCDGPRLSTSGGPCVVPCLSDPGGACNPVVPVPCLSAPGGACNPVVQSFLEDERRVWECGGLQHLEAVTREPDGAEEDDVGPMRKVFFTTYGGTANYIHGYFNNFEARRCCLLLSAGQTSPVHMKLVCPEQLDLGRTSPERMPIYKEVEGLTRKVCPEQLDLGRTSPERMPIYKEVEGLTRKEFYVYQHAVMAAHFPVLSAPLPPHDVSPPPQLLPFLPLVPPIHVQPTLDPRARVSLSPSPIMPSTRPLRQNPQPTMQNPSEISQNPQPTMHIPSEVTQIPQPTIHNPNRISQYPQPIMRNLTPDLPNQSPIPCKLRKNSSSFPSLHYRGLEPKISAYGGVRKKTPCRDSSYESGSEVEMGFMSGVDRGSDLSVIPIETMCDALRQAFCLSKQLARQYDKITYEPYRKKSNAKILAEELVSQLSFLESDKHPFYNSHTFRASEGYQTWQRQQRAEITALIQKFWQFSLPSLRPAPDTSPTGPGGHTDHHTSYRSLLHKLISHELRLKQGCEEMVPLLPLSGASQRILLEFSLRYGIGDLYMQTVYLEYLSEVFCLQPWYLLHTTSCVLHLLHQAHKVKIIATRWEFDVAEKSVGRLLELTEKSLCRCQQLSQAESGADTISLLVDLMSVLVRFHASLLEGAITPQADALRDRLTSCLRTGLRNVYRFHKTTAQEDLKLDSTGSKVTPKLINRLLSACRDEVQVLEHLGDIYSSHGVDVVSLATDTLYSLLMDDVELLCRQDPTCKQGDIDLGVLSLVYRLNQLDTDWSSYIKPSQQTWRLFCGSRISHMMAALQGHVTSLVLQAVANDKFRDVTSKEFADSQDRSSSPGSNAGSRSDSVMSRISTKSLHSLTPSSRSAFSPVTRAAPPYADHQHGNQTKCHGTNQTPGQSSTPSKCTSDLRYNTPEADHPKFSSFAETLLRSRHLSANSKCSPRNSTSQASAENNNPLVTGKDFTRSGSHSSDDAEIEPLKISTSVLDVIVILQRLVGLCNTLCHTLYPTHDASCDTSGHSVYLLHTPCPNKPTTSQLFSSNKRKHSPADAINQNANQNDLTYQHKSVSDYCNISSDHHDNHKPSCAVIGQSHDNVSANESRECFLCDQRGKLLNSFFKLIDETVAVYWTNLLAMDLCGISQGVSKTVCDKNLVKRVRCEHKAGRVWGCRHSTEQLTTCPIITDYKGCSGELPLLVDNKMCIRVNNLMELSHILPSLIGKMSANFNQSHSSHSLSEKTPAVPCSLVDGPCKKLVFDKNESYPSLSDLHPSLPGLSESDAGFSESEIQRSKGRGCLTTDSEPEYKSLCSNDPGITVRADVHCSSEMRSDKSRGKVKDDSGISCQDDQDLGRNTFRSPEVVVESGVAGESGDAGESRVAGKGVQAGVASEARVASKAGVANKVAVASEAIVVSDAGVASEAGVVNKHDKAGVDSEVGVANETGVANKAGVASGTGVASEAGVASKTGVAGVGVQAGVANENRDASEVVGYVGQMTTNDSGIGGHESDNLDEYLDTVPVRHKTGYVPKQANNNKTEMVGAQCTEVHSGSTLPQEGMVAMVIGVNTVANSLCQLLNFRIHQTLSSVMHRVLTNHPTTINVTVTCRPLVNHIRTTVAFLKCWLAQGKCTTVMETIWKNVAEDLWGFVLRLREEIHTAASRARMLSRVTALLLDVMVEADSGVTLDYLVSTMERVMLNLELFALPSNDLIMNYSLWSSLPDTTQPTAAIYQLYIKLQAELGSVSKCSSHGSVKEWIAGNWRLACQGASAIQPDVNSDGTSPDDIIQLLVDSGLLVKLEQPSPQITDSDLDQLSASTPAASHSHFIQSHEGVDVHPYPPLLQYRPSPESSPQSGPSFSGVGGFYEEPVAGFEVKRFPKCDSEYSGCLSSDEATKDGEYIRNQGRERRRGSERLEINNNMDYYTLWDFTDWCLWLNNDRFTFKSCSMYQYYSLGESSLERSTRYRDIPPSLVDFPVLALRDRGLTEDIVLTVLASRMLQEKAVEEFLCDLPPEAVSRYPWLQKLLRPACDCCW